MPILRSQYSHIIRN